MHERQDAVAEQLEVALELAEAADAEPDRASLAVPERARRVAQRRPAAIVDVRAARRRTRSDQFEQVVIGVSIEGIVGWKSRSSWWFDHHLASEEFDEYRRTIGAPLRTIFYFDGQSHVDQVDA